MAGRILFSVGCLFLLINMSAAMYGIPGATECYNRTLTKGPGILNVTSVNITTTCYNFIINGVQGNIFYTINSTFNMKQVASVSIYNINSTSTELIQISSRSFSNSSVDPGYIVVGYGNQTAKVGMVVVNLTKPLGKDDFFIAGKYSNDTNACDLEVESPAPRELRVPDHQPNIKTKFTCSYTYQLPEEVNPAMYSFTQFKFTSGSLTVGSMAGTEKFKGQELPHDIIAKSTLVVKMSVDVGNGDTFTASSSAYSPDCSKVRNVTSSGTVITSVGYSEGGYSNNIDCKLILLSTDPSKHLKVVVNDIDLALDHDHVEVIDGGASRSLDTKQMAYLTALDGYKSKDNTMVTSGSAVMVRFVTDQFGTAQGLNISVNLTEEGYRYYTPAPLSYVSKTNNSESTELVIQAPFGYVVELTPTAINSEDGSVMCYDGETTHCPLIAIYKSGLDMYPAYSSGSHLRILCVTDNFLENDNFTANTNNAVIQDLSKFSSKEADSYSLHLSAVSNATYEWVVLPTDTSLPVIQLEISKFSYSGSANVTVDVRNLKNTSFGGLSPDTPLPYAIRMSASLGLRILIKVSVPPKPNATVTDIFTDLTLAASYALYDSFENVTADTGVISSPRYPEATPARTTNVWSFTVPANESYQFSFNPQFELSAGSNLTISAMKSNTTILYTNLTGPMLVSPSDVILNNTEKALKMRVLLNTLSQSSTTGVQITYTRLDAGYSSALDAAPQDVMTPGYPKPVTTTTRASWVFSVARNNSKGLLQRVQAQILFMTNTNATLELRDGPKADSPLITLNSSSVALKLAEGKGHSVVTSSNFLYVSYRFSAAKNQTGSPLLVTAVADVCTNSSQCQTGSKETVCMPDSWKCDGVYQCIDGKDELNCKAPPTTKSPAVTKEGAKWWVVILCMLAGVIIGIIGSVVCVVVMVKRRGSGYNRLSELMTPVPT